MKSMKGVLNQFGIEKHVICLHSLVIGYTIYDIVYFALNHLIS